MRELNLWNNRVVCNVIDEIQTCIKTQNYSYLPGLVEEMQSMANRMESAIGDIRDIKKISERRRFLKKAIKELEHKFEKLGGKDESLSDE